MNKEEAINIINTILKEHFNYVPLDTTLKITETLINKEVIKVEEEKEETEHNLRVCDHCLAAIQSREGYLPIITVHVDLEDDKGKCEWCEQDGYDTLYELIKFYNKKGD